MIRSIRFRLTLWYVGILAIILILFGGLLYTNVKRNLSKDIDALLATQAEGVTDTLFAFWLAERDMVYPEAPPERWSQMPGTSESLQNDVDEGRFPGLVNRWADEMDELETFRPIRILDREGQFLRASPSFRKLALPFTKAALNTAVQGRATFETFNAPEAFNVRNQRIRVVTWPVVEDSRLLYIVQVAASLRQAEASLGGMRLWLFLLVPFTLAGTSMAGWFLATKALRPVGDITAQAQRISAEQLHERIHIPRTGDELDALALTFNRMLSRLEQAFKRMRQFSAAASHELRTPLTIMKGEVEVALRKPREGGEYQRVLKTQLEVLNEMISTVEQLLTLAHSVESENAVQWQPVDLGALTRRVCEAWQPIADSKEIRVNVPVSRDPLWIRGEQRLLERMVANLLDNALKHTPVKGEVLLEISRENKEAQLLVKDTGPGIPPDDLPKIFDKFFIRRPKNDSGRSTGLGLGLCRWIVELHQGRIEASSPPGQGAIFTVKLPISSLPNPVSG